MNKFVSVQKCMRNKGMIDSECVVKAAENIDESNGMRKLHLTILYSSSTYTGILLFPTNENLFHSLRFITQSHVLATTIRFLCLHRRRLSLSVFNGFGLMTFHCLARQKNQCFILFETYQHQKLMAMHETICFLLSQQKKH